MIINKQHVVSMNINYVRFPLDYFLDGAVAMGLDKIEIWGGAPHLMPDWETPVSMRKIKHAIRSRLLQVSCFTPEQCKYPISLAIQEKAMREYSIGFFERSIDLALELDCPKVLVTAGYGFENHSLDEAWKLCADSLFLLADYAKQKGAYLCLEVLSTRTSNIVNNSKQAAKMIADVGADNIYGMIDFCQMAEAFEEPEDYFRNYGYGRIRHIHIIDGNPIGHFVLGKGIFPLKKWCEQIVSLGYQGDWSLEICDTRTYHDPNQAVKDSIELMLDM